MTCEGCAERRQKIVKAAHNIIDWIKKPSGQAPFDQLIGGIRPPAPLRPPREIVNPNKTKK